MIPTIETILGDLKAGLIDVNRAMSLIEQHTEDVNLRDSFAMCALTGLTEMLPGDTAKAAYAIADAMMEQRKIR